jgi:hypothetical protein
MCVLLSYLLYYVCIAVLVVIWVYCCTCCTIWVLLYLLYYVCIGGVTLDDELLARSQYSEGPATGHLDTGFSWFPCVYKQMLRWLLCFQVATTCFSCSPPDLNLNVCLLHVKWPLPPGDSPIAVIIIIIIIIIEVPHSSLDTLHTFLIVSPNLSWKITEQHVNKTNHDSLFHSTASCRIQSTIVLLVFHL